MPTKHCQVNNEIFCTFSQKNQLILFVSDK